MSVECTIGTCHNNCKNNLMETYEWKSVYVNESPIHNFGLFANEIIFKGNFIMEYLGTEYEKNNQTETKSSKYKMEMTHHYIDAEKEGSLARYINHCDEPNAMFKKIFVGGVERSAVYAAKDIVIDDEITCMYLKKIRFNITVKRKTIMHWGAEYI